MSQQDDITRLLGIQGWQIKSIYQFTAAAEITIERTTGNYPCCPHCEQMCFVYDHCAFRSVRDFPAFGKAVLIRFRAARINCPRCGVHTEKLDWVLPYQRQTLRYQRYVAALCRLMPVLDVAKLEGLDKTTVYTIDKSWLERRHELQPKRAVKRIGIDEIAISSGHSYATVIYDLDRREVIGITCGRRYKDLCKILKEWPAQMREGVVAVCTDLWSPFHKAVRKHLPNAELVFDKFHVYKYLNDAVDQVRRCEMNKVSGELKTLIKGSRWIWLKKKTNLTDGQIIRLKEIVALNQNLFEAYLLKENFEEFYSCSSAKTGIEFLEQWFLRCKESGLKPMIQLAKRIKRWMDGILNYFKYKITNAVAEGINNKIKVLKRRSYGFHDMHYFFLKILDITGALPPLSSVTHNISE